MTHKLLCLILLVGLPTTTSSSCNSVLDQRDGRSYPTRTIGNLEWLATNLAVATPDSWCFDDTQDCDKNGRLYTWAAAISACPAGWRLASDEDWLDLERALGMDSQAAAALGPRGTDQGEQLRSGGASGFEAPICGYRRPDGTFARRNERTAFWTATEVNADDAWHRDIRGDVGTVYRSPVTKTYALSVRCVKEKLPHHTER